MKLTYCILLTLLLPATILHAQTPAPVTIPNSQNLKLSSSLTGQPYELRINLPAGYSDSGKAYPVLYLLDAQWDFPLLSAIYGEQYFDGFIPGIIVVGITWGGDHPDYDALRAHDFTPSSPDGSAKFGDAAKFLTFIKHDLIPFVDGHFHTAKNDRVLMGSSFGGLFTLYTFYNETELFHRYVLTSPAIQFSSRVLDSCEKVYAAKRSAVPVKLYMGIGGLEPNVPFFLKYIDHLKAAKYAGLEMSTLVMENTGHSGTKPEGYTRGLQYVFARPSLTLAPDLLGQYAGTWTNDRDTLTLVVTNGQLRALVGFGLDLHAATDSDFYLPGQLLNIHFKKDGAGMVKGFHLERYGGSADFEKMVKGKVYHWNDLKAKEDSLGRVGRPILEGSTRDLALLEIHASSVAPGKAPHPPHMHADQEEMMIIKEGKLSVTIAGKTTLLGPGSVAMILPGDEHGFINAGQEEATYYILKFQSRTPMDAQRGRNAGGSIVVNWDTLHAQGTDRGEKRELFERPTSLFNKVELHVTTLNAGMVSHAPHTHRQEEIILLRKGDVQMQIGNSFYNASAGDLIFLNSEVLHALKNTGTEQCQYYALQWQ